jgi:hypothetical protein
MKKIISLMLILGILLQGVLWISGVSANTSGLVASYDFNGDTQDTSWNNHHATANSITYETLSNGNKVASFNGSNSTITPNNISSFKSISLWTLAKWYDSNYVKYIISWGKVDSQNNFHLWVEKNSSQKIITFLNTWWSLTSTINKDNRLKLENKYQHIYLELDNWVLKLYQNWLLTVQYTYNNNVNIIDATNLILGKYITTGWVHHFNGNISQLKFYNKVLSESERNNLYQEWKDYLGLPKIDWLITSYDLNGDTQDSSWNENHATANNITYETLSNGNKVATLNGSNSYTEIWEYIWYTNQTVSAWYYLNEETNGNYMIYEDDNFRFRVNSAWSDILSWDSRNGTWNFHYISWYIPKIKEWVHLTITAEGTSNYKLYENWILVPTNINTTSTFNRTHTTANVWRSNDGNSYFNWNLGQINVYNKSLSQEEINTLYQQWQEYLGLQNNTWWLVASYDFNWNAQDSSWNENHGSVNWAQLTSDRYWNPNSAYLFDGNNDGITLSNTENVKLNGNYWTSMWVKINNLDSNVWTGHDTNIKGALFFWLHPYFRLWISNNNKLLLRQKIWWTWYNTESDNTLSEWEWLHIIATHDNTTWKDYLYINWEKVNSIDTSAIWDYTTYTSTSHKNSIWARQYNSATPNTNFFSWIIDEVKIYNSYITPEKVSDLYRPLDTSWLVASYDLNWNAQDSSGNGNHGTESNLMYETLSNGNKVAKFNWSNTIVVSNITPYNNNNFTWNTWIKKTSSTVRVLASTKQEWWYVSLIPAADGRMEFRMQTSTPGSVFSTTTVDDNNYHMVTWIRNNNEIELFIDGISQWTNNFDWSIGWNQLFLWNFSSLIWSVYFDWYLSQFTSYNKALTQAEINTLYHEWQEYLGLNTPVVEIPSAPSNFIAENITSDSVSYTWNDNSSDLKQEDKFVIKDENNAIVKDNITANSTNIWEPGLQSSTQYQRKICAVNSTGEICSDLITFTTQIEVIEWKTTPFDFMWIVINVIETAQMFKVEFVIWGFKINFSIEKIL